ncbi:MAG: TerC family protein [Bacteroidia bacterium]
MSLLTLTLMEVVLGIDNIVFISIVAGRVPQEQQAKARMIGLSLALIIRIMLLFTITEIMKLERPLFTINDFDMSAKDLILLAGGLFLLTKSTTEIHDKLEGEHDERNMKTMILRTAVFQIVMLDIVFSIDSILTAIGIGEHISIMIIAVIISMGVMLAFAKKISDFVNKHPTVKMLALSFLLLIGFLLCAEALHFHVPKGYVYTAMAFSFMVELLNMQMRKRRAKPVKLRGPYDEMPAEDVLTGKPLDNK